MFAMKSCLKFSMATCFAFLLLTTLLGRPAFCGEIHNAARDGDLGRVKALLKDNSDLLFSKDNQYGGTPLHWAAVSGHKAVAEFLLASKAEVNATNNKGWTPLHDAVISGHKEMAEFLLANSAKVNATNNDGDTPLQLAVNKDRRDLAELLREHGGAIFKTSMATSPTPTGKQKEVVVDANMHINGLPISSPIFRIQGTDVAFQGGDYRNTVLDFRHTHAPAFGFAEVMSDAGGLGSGDQRHFVINVVLDETDLRAFFDANWVYYPGSLRQVREGGPFASIYVECTRQGQPASGVSVATDGIVTQTITDGTATLNLQNIHKQIFSIKFTDPQNGKVIEKRIPVPIVCACTNEIQYQTIKVELIDRP